MLQLVQEMQQILLRKILEALWDGLTCVYPQYRCHLWAIRQQVVGAVAVLDGSLLCHFEAVRLQPYQAYDLEMVETEVELSLSQVTVKSTAQQAVQEGMY